MSIKSPKELEGLKRIGRIVASVMHEMAASLEPGMTTADLDAIGRAALARDGARSAPILTYGFPGATCISINDEAAHGIPGRKVIRAGDLVNIDVSAELDGFFADTGASFMVPPATPEMEALCAAGKAALSAGIAAVKAGAPINGIGRAVQTEAKRMGYGVVGNLGGHGVGRKLHEQPNDVLNYFEPRDRRRLTEGLVFTIEPFLLKSREPVVQVLEKGDGWTLLTPNGALVVQYEHTVVVHGNTPIIVTSLDEAA